MALGTVRIFGCGGAGINLTTKFCREHKASDDITVLAGCFDTSKSNLHNLDKGIEHYLLSNADGSGGIRRSNSDAIMDCVKEMLVAIKPADFNLVVFSTSGGSGSVIGPAIVRELNLREIPVVIIAVGNTESDIAVSNTLNTLKTLDAISARTSAPVVISYSHHSDKLSRQDIDREILGSMLALTTLFSKNTAELDSMDVSNFIQYHKPTGLEPSLAVLDIQTAPDDVTPVAVAAILPNPNAARIQLKSIYQTIGYRDLTSSGVDALYFTISPDKVDTLVGLIKEELSRFNELKNSRRSVKRLFAADEGDDKGLIV